MRTGQSGGMPCSVRGGTHGSQRISPNRKMQPPMDADQVSGWSVPLQSVAWASRPKESAATGGYTSPHQNRDVPLQRKRKTTDFADEHRSSKRLGVPPKGTWLEARRLPQRSGARRSSHLINPQAPLDSQRVPCCQMAPSCGVAVTFNIEFWYSFAKMHASVAKTRGPVSRTRGPVSRTRGPVSRTHRSILASFFRLVAAKNNPTRGPESRRRGRRRGIPAPRLKTGRWRRQGNVRRWRGRRRCPWAYRR